MENKTHLQHKYRGRGISFNPTGRFETTTKHLHYVAARETTPKVIVTELRTDNAKSILTTNQSPDIPFDVTVNPYRGCEHGCVYCFARSTHSYLNLSPGLDFETKIFSKPNAPQLLRMALSNPKYICKTISIGNITDAYQPLERKLEITRKILLVLAECKHPAYIVTKSSLIERDIDVLSEMARLNLVHVWISITTLNGELAHVMEPRATVPARRLQVISALRKHGIKTGVIVAPIIPGLNDHELETILAHAKKHDASDASYVMLRLSHEVKDLFTTWLQHHFSQRANRILHILQSMHGGKEYRSTFGDRMRGQGPFADLIARRFRLACKKLNIQRFSGELNTQSFIAPKEKGDGQMSLFEC